MQEAEWVGREESDPTEYPIKIIELEDIDINKFAGTEKKKDL